MATYQDSRYNIALPSGAGGAISLIKTITASNDSTISFVDCASDVVLDNTYRTYLFKFINLHTTVDDCHTKVNFSADTGSNYNVTKTASFFKATHLENGTGGALAYDTGHDIAQGTGVTTLKNDHGSGNDESASGELWLFNPSSTTYVKHFVARFQDIHSAVSMDTYTAGYFNTTSAIDEISFKCASGNIDSGTFKLYGIKDS